MKCPNSSFEGLSFQEQMDFLARRRAPLEDLIELAEWFVEKARDLERFAQRMVDLPGQTDFFYTHWRKVLRDCAQAQKICGELIAG